MFEKRIYDAQKKEEKKESFDKMFEKRIIERSIEIFIKCERPRVKKILSYFQSSY